MNKSLTQMEIELLNLRNQNKDAEADELQVEIGKQKAKLVLGNIAINPMSTILSAMNKPIKPKDDEHELYLIRFEEGIKPGFDLCDGTVPVRWRSNPFIPMIPMIGIEIKKDDPEKVLEKVKTIPGCIKLQKTYLFHEYSFLEI